MNGYSVLNRESRERIYVMRHGETALDSTHRSDGWLDLPLSDEGRQGVVETLSDYLKFVPITCIYCAPFKRTKETAEILKSGIVSDPHIEISPEAKTWNLGSLAGDPKQPNKAVVRDLIANPEKKAPDGESYDEFTGRFDKWLRKQERESKTEGPLLLVLSGSNCRRISECLMNDRAALDIDTGGLFVMYPDEKGKWTADLIAGHRDLDDLTDDPENS